ATSRYSACLTMGAVMEGPRAVPVIHNYRKAHHTPGHGHAIAPPDPGETRARRIRGAARPPRRGGPATAPSGAPADRSGFRPLRRGPAAGPAEWPGAGR